MKPGIISVICVVALFCFIGCSRNTTRTTPLGDGYEEVVYVYPHFSEPESHTITLQFRNSEGKQVMVWPSLMSATVVRDGIAIFVANRTMETNKTDGIWPQTCRLFAVRAPEQPLDITDEVVGRWAQESGKDVVKYLEGPEPIEPQEKNGKIDTEFSFYNFPGIVVSLSWEQLSKIMDEVKTNGIQAKDPKWNLTCIGKKFKAGFKN
jgi:hypothetical protein